MSAENGEGVVEQFLPPSVKWLLDHYQFLELQVAETRDALSARMYRALPHSTNGSCTVPLIHQSVAALVQRTLERDSVEGQARSIDGDALITHFEAAQATRALCLAELWAIRPLIKLSLLEALAHALTAHPLDADTCETVARSAISNLYALDELPWRELTESLSALHDVLRLDPAGIYLRMDFETRDSYRRAVEAIAKRCGWDEPDVARLAIELACEPCRDTGGNERTDHVGYYLVGNGIGALEARLPCTSTASIRFRRAVSGWMGVVYPTSIIVVTALIVAATTQFLRPLPSWFALLLILPALHAAVAIVNGVAHAALPPRRLSRLDFSEGVPDDCRTFVVVPTLLFSGADVQGLLETLELHYLANRDPNVRFALLTDGADSTERTAREELADICREGIEELNERHSDVGGGPFYLFHRGRRWNERESLWMGRERKRGKLNDFNAFLLGGADPFDIKAGDLSAIGSVRYVITLDRDTQLPLENARKLIGTAAHPLNTPIIDSRTNTVRHGYAVLQPRIGVSLVSAERSRFADLQSGAVGLDPYTTGVSDVYQDMCGQASFVGKGLYDLSAFHRVASDRFPDNILLSHDLIEGEHARVGLVSDVEVIDDYPGSYEAYSKRKHRWIRGDWQLVRWLLPWVPGRQGFARNPLSFISRWKIVDNLRRSALEASAVALLVGGWRQGHAVGCAIAVGIFLNAGAYVDLLLSGARLPQRRLLRSYLRTKAAHFGRSLLETLVCLIFLMHQAFVATDAIVRTLVRQFVTGRHLLEWESMAQADSAQIRSSSFVRSYLFVTPLVALVLLAAFWSSKRSPGWLPIGVCVGWMASPAVASWMNRRGSQLVSWAPADVTFLRDVALRTWRYFVDWSESEVHWLVPDNIDEASDQVTDRTSPTNIGLQLTATLAAHDFGYLTQQELAATMTRVLDTLERLESYRGHFYNWYDTRSLEPLLPRYVSSVDSGNLCASLVTVQQGCLEAFDEPIVSSQLWTGLRDHLACAQRTLHRDARDRSFRALAALLAADGQPSEVSALHQALRTMRQLATVVFEANVANEEAGYWLAALLARIDASLYTLNTLAPFVETPFASESLQGPLGDRLRQIDEAARRTPPLSDLQAHYDELERAARHCLRSLASTDRVLARSLIRFCEQIAGARAAATALERSLRAASDRASRIAGMTDFSFLFDPRRKLLRVGYDVDREELDQSCYGLLASEARVAVFFAIAKRDIPVEAWFHLGRALTRFGNDRTLVSWSGTMFEYTMPLLFMKCRENTLLGASVRRAVSIQQTYGRKRHVPWGLSEAAYSGYDEGQGRRYQAFGIPQLAMKRMRDSDLVVAPYATLLALNIARAAALDNLRSMASKGWLGRFGFYESIDYRSHESDRTTRPQIVPLFMAHHQGMSLIAIDNALFDNAMQRRFHAEPLIATVERLLEERVPGVIPESAKGALPSDMPTRPHLQLNSRPEREIGPASENAMLRAS
jgi:hypothetical protein